MVSFTVCMVLCSRYKSQSQVCKGSACTMLAVVALDPVWAALCWSVCPWITARRARSLSQCGAAHRWPPQWSSPITLAEGRPLNGGQSNILAMVMRRSLHGMANRPIMILLSTCSPARYDKGQLVERLLRKSLIPLSQDIWSVQKPDAVLLTTRGDDHIMAEFELCSLLWLLPGWLW